MRAGSPRAILFDWDNTLVDSWACIHRAVNETLRAFGQPEWSWEESRRRIGLSLRDSFPKLFGERWEEARDHYYRAFEAVHLDGLAPLPGVEAMLEALAGRGVWLGVVSNKTGRYVRREAAHLGWQGYFQRLVGATDAARDKPAPEPVLMALEGSGVAPGAEVWFVGDAAVDIACAAATGCRPVLLRPEAPAAEELGLAPDVRHCRDCTDFLRLVSEVSVPISRF